MEIVKKIVIYKISDLVLSEYNPRTITKKARTDLTTSMRKFGIVDPIIINKRKDRMNVVIGGHQRIKIAKSLKVAEVPCVELNLTLKLEKELNIRLNKNKGKFDFALLEDNFEQSDLISYGFDANDLLTEELPPIKPKEEIITKIKQVHVLISVNVDDFEKIKGNLEKIQKTSGIEYEQNIN